MQTVIKVSKQLLAALEVADAVGMSACHCLASGVVGEEALLRPGGIGGNGAKVVTSLFSLLPQSALM